MKILIETAIAGRLVVPRAGRRLGRDGLLGVIAAVVLGLALGYSMAPTPVTAHAASHVAPPMAPRTPHAGAPVAPLPGLSAGAPAPIDSAALYRAMLGSTNLRAFVAEAKRQPEIGGYFYARQALRLCAFQNLPEGRSAADSRRYVHGENPAAYSRRMQAIDRFERRCAGFAPGEAAAALDGIEAEGARAGDALLGTLDRLARGGRRWRDGNDASAWTDALAAAFASGDALLWDADALPALLAARDGAVWFEGVRYAGAGAFELMQAALMLVGCGLGSPCDERDPLVENACLSGDDCLARREAVVALRVADGDAQRMAQMLALRDRLLRAIADGNVAAFMPRG
ncbi:hypothetical protein [Derxia lacustris]|uniref:hypothetical protein n=1 Tax=Derxia lacustris TaxID=764842 RepID=UPI000A177017|nr:hypothetical protein [Derxia lacustris]